MDMPDLQRMAVWVSLLALGAASLAALVFWLRFRTLPAAVVFLSMAAFVIAALVIEAFPAYRLGRHPITGEQAVIAQNQTLHKCLYVIMGMAGLTSAAGFWWLLHTVVPKRQANERRA